MPRVSDGKDLRKSIAKVFGDGARVFRKRPYFYIFFVEQVCVETPPSALGVTLPAFASGRWRLQQLSIDMMISPAGHSAANLPARAGLLLNVLRPASRRCR